MKTDPIVSRPIYNANKLKSTDIGNIEYPSSGDVLAWDAITSSWNLSKVNTFIVITNYGAVGDGVTDDTTAINDAIEQAGLNGGGTVYFPATTSSYLVTGITVNYPNVCLMCDKGSTVKLADDSTSAILTIKQSNVGVFYGTWDGNKANQTAVTDGLFGIFVWAQTNGQSLTNVIIQNVTVKDTLNAGIMFKQTGAGATVSKCRVNQCNVSNTGNASLPVIAEGIALYGPSYCEISDNIIDTTGNHGIVSTQGNYIKFLGNQSLNAGANYNNGFAHGLAIDGNGGLNPTFGHIVANNYVENAYDQGIEIADQVNEVSITSNVVNTTGVGNGIYYGGGLALSYVGTIVGNTIYNAGRRGIMVEGPSDIVKTVKVTVTGNTVFNSKYDGIYVHRADEVVVTGNNTTNNSTAGSGLYSGILISKHDRCVISSNHASDTRGPALQAYGINIVDAPANKLIVSSNDLGPNLSGAITGYNVAKVTCKDNSGFNPLLYTVTTPALTSPQTNNTGVDVMVYFVMPAGNVTVSISGTVVVNSTSLSTASCYLPVGATLSWTGSPTSYKWVGL